MQEQGIRDCEPVPVPLPSEGAVRCGNYVEQRLSAEWPFAETFDSGTPKANMLHRNAHGGAARASIESSWKWFG